MTLEKNQALDQTLKWIRTWKRAGVALEKVRKRELRQFDYSGNQTLIDEMLQWACDHPRIRKTSGMVEMQRIFMKMRKKQDNPSKCKKPQEGS